MRRFFDFINFCEGESMDELCNRFAYRGRNDSSWVFGNILRFLHSQKERVERKEITASTLGNYVKTIMFCDVTDIPFNGRKLQEDCQRGKDMQMIEHPLWKRSIKSSNILIEE